MVNQYEDKILRMSQVVEVNNGNQYMNILNKMSEATIIDSQISSQAQKKKVKRLKKTSMQSERAISHTMAVNDKYKTFNTIIQK